MARGWGVRKSPLFWPLLGPNSLPLSADSAPLGMFTDVFIKPVQACTCSFRHALVPTIPSGGGLGAQRLLGSPDLGL